MVPTRPTFVQTFVLPQQNLRRRRGSCVVPCGSDRVSTTQTSVFPQPNLHCRRGSCVVPCGSDRASAAQTPVFPQISGLLWHAKSKAVNTTLGTTGFNFPSFVGSSSVSMLSSMHGVATGLRSLSVKPATYYFSFVFNDFDRLFWFLLDGGGSTWR